MCIIVAIHTDFTCFTVARSDELICAIMVNNLEKYVGCQSYFNMTDPVCSATAERDPESGNFSIVVSEAFTTILFNAIYIYI